jgi:hypothetical protein
MRLTPERIFKAGFLLGFLTREEQGWLKTLGDSDVTKRVLEKRVYEKFSMEHPDLAAEWTETVKQMNEAIRRRKPTRRKKH